MFLIPPCGILEMMKTFFLSLLFLGLSAFSPSLDSARAAEEVLDAHTGTNVRREYTDTGSLFNVLRDVYRPDYHKKSKAPSQTPYQRVAPPKWSYYGTAPKGETPKKKAGVERPYYKKKTPSSESKK